jgi:hypothetical protein
MGLDQEEFPKVLNFATAFEEVDSCLSRGDVTLGEIRCYASSALRNGLLAWSMCFR